VCGPTPTQRRAVAARRGRQGARRRAPAIDFGRYTEVTITRRLFRDGTSHYLINKTPCRLARHHDFFLGTGRRNEGVRDHRAGPDRPDRQRAPQDRRAIIELLLGRLLLRLELVIPGRLLDDRASILRRALTIWPIRPCSMIAYAFVPTPVPRKKS